MLDVHTHILPGLDDGASSMDESLEMAELAVESGVTELVVTPHSNQLGRFENYCSKELQETYEAFLSELKKADIPLKLHPGMEIFVTEDVCERIKDGSLMGLNATDTYLVEFPFDAEPEWIYRQLYKLRDLKKRVLIAHPERYYCVQDAPWLVYEWIKMGCLSQVNKGSILGRFGKRVWLTADVLLRHDLVSCVASDAHSIYMRTTYMQEVRELIEEHFGEIIAKRLLKENPARIINGRSVPVHGILPEKRKFFIGR